MSAILFGPGAHPAKIARINRTPITAVSRFIFISYVPSVCSGAGKRTNITGLVINVWKHSGWIFNITAEDRMNAIAEITINGSREQVWKVISDIDNSVNVISGIESVEILHRPDNGFIGLKWKETRNFLGKTATEIMWIVDSDEPSAYSVRAESHGSVYLTDFEVSGTEPDLKLTTRFRSEPNTFGARLMDFLFGGMMKKATEKAFLEDLNDIKRKVEK